ncbi:MAG: pilus assembly protein PilM [Victivallales bacterium]|nr:pilus assembly protein PilM [Victivallales bacterium]
MRFKPSKQAFGLDIGQATVKVVGLSRKGKSVVVSCLETMNVAKEGILDELELYSEKGLVKWLSDKGLMKHRFCLALPQYMCTTQVSDFAPGAKDDELANMVHYETMQLAGLSEEAFLSDYDQMQPGFGRNNPVLIGVCREKSVEENCARVSELGISLHDVGMSGIAAANAFYQLHPEAVEDQTPQLLLDLGVENSTAVILAGGNILYTGSLMFGAKRFTQAIAVAAGVSETEAENMKPDYEADWEGEDSPILLVARQLESELKITVDHWRASENSELNQELVSHIWLCGGGASTKGLAEHLARTYGCPVTPFGPSMSTAPVEGQISVPRPIPEYTIAYGLALQSLGEARFAISLAPEMLRWQRHKEDRFPYLVATTVVIFTLIATAMLVADFWLTQATETLETGMSELTLCTQTVPKLDAAREQIAYQQKLILPIVELGSRAKLFTRTIEEVSKALGKGDWCVYITDEFSHVDYGNIQKETERKPERPAGPASMFGGLQPTEETTDPATGSNNIDVATMPLLRTMIIGGFTPVPGNKRFESVLAIQNRLNACGLFQRVDWLDENTESSGREQQIMQPWSAYLRSQRFLFGEHTDFKLKLPFQTTSVKPPPPEAVKKKKSKK